MAHYAQVERGKYAPLLSDFARDFVTRKWGPELASIIFEECPRYVRGPKKGQPKGWVKWDKCTKGGWFRTGPNYYGEPGTNGYVMAPGVQNVRIVFAFEADQGVTTPREWPSCLTDAEKVEWLRRGLATAATMKPGERRYG